MILTPETIVRIESTCCPECKSPLAANYYGKNECEKCQKEVVVLHEREDITLDEFVTRKAKEMAQEHWGEMTSDMYN